MISVFVPEEEEEELEVISIHSYITKGSQILTYF